MSSCIGSLSYLYVSCIDSPVGYIDVYFNVKGGAFQGQCDGFEEREEEMPLVWKEKL